LLVELSKLLVYFHFRSVKLHYAYVEETLMIVAFFIFVFISKVMETPKNSVRFYLEAKTRQNKKDHPNQEEIGWRSWHERFCSIR